MNFVERGKAVMGKSPPVRAILEDVSAHGAVTRNRQQRRPLIDGDAGVVGLDEPCAAQRPAVELLDIGHAADPVSDQTREDAPFALGPLTEVGVARREEALRITASLAWSDRFAKHLDVLAGGHLQPSEAENAFDLLRRHGCTFVWGAAAGSRCAVTQSAASKRSAVATSAISAPIETRRASRARARSARCTTSTVASSLLPLVRANSMSLTQRVASGVGPLRSRAISCGPACL